KYVAAIGPDGGFYLCPVAEGLASAIRGIEPGETPIQWSADGRSIYVLGPQYSAVKIFRVDLESGKRILWRSLALPDEVGSVGLAGDQNAVRVTPDGKYCLYTYTILLGELHLVEGLR